MDNIFLAELVGTAILILLGDGVVAGVLLSKSKAENSGWIVITTGWALAVAMAVYMVGHFDAGAHLNPAVTFGLWASGADFTASQIFQYVGGQFVGAFIGATLVFLHYMPHWKQTEDPGLKLAVFATGPAIRSPANVISEFIGTFMLIFGILAIGHHMGAITDGNLNQAFGTGITPLLIGFLIWAIGLSLGGPTGYAINPARDLGPRIMHAILPIPGKGSSDWGYSWVPVVGPIVGGVVAGFVYKGLYPG